MTDPSAGAKPGGSAPELAFNLLGSLQVLHRGEPVQLGGRQQKAVLARMLVEPGAVLSTERLADAIWGGDVPDAAVATIQTYVSHLRETLEPHVPRADRRNVVVTEARGYRLQVHGATVDAITFEEAAAAGRVEL